MSKHTPGPWTAETHANGGFDVCGRGGHGAMSAYVVCARQAHELKHETHANARLIAAAPELLEALDRLASKCVFPTSGNDAFQEAVSHARSVLAKATGEQP